MTMENVKDILKNNFNEVDFNSDGYLTKNELKQILKRENPGKRISRSEIVMIFNQLDVSHDGKISYEGKK